MHMLWCYMYKYNVEAAGVIEMKLEVKEETIY